jgi:hypothetical protein
MQSTRPPLSSERLELALRALGRMIGSPLPSFRTVQRLIVRPFLARTRPWGRVIGTCGTCRTHGEVSLRSRVTSGAMVPDSSRSPLPANPLLTMQPVKRPRRTINRGATR